MGLRLLTVAHCGLLDVLLQFRIVHNSQWDLVMHNLNESWHSLISCKPLPPLTLLLSYWWDNGTRCCLLLWNLHYLILTPFSWTLAIFFSNHIWAFDYRTVLLVLFTSSTVVQLMCKHVHFLVPEMAIWLGGRLPREKSKGSIFKWNIGDSLSGLWTTERLFLKEFSSLILNTSNGATSSDTAWTSRCFCFL